VTFFLPFGLCPFFILLQINTHRAVELRCWIFGKEKEEEEEHRRRRRG
jgi:hypothetical protein